MQWDVRHQGIEITSKLRAFLDKRIELSLRPFSHHIAGVRVYLRDLNGPRGGVDSECQVMAKLLRGDSIVVTATAIRAEAAIANAADRARLAVKRRVKRRLARRRPQRRSILPNAQTAHASIDST